MTQHPETPTQASHLCRLLNTSIKAGPLSLLLVGALAGCTAAPVEDTGSSEPQQQASSAPTVASSAPLMSSSSAQFSSSVISSSSVAPIISSSSQMVASSSSSAPVATIPSNANLVLAVNAGGGATTLAGVQYIADRFSTGGNTYSVQNDISGTNEDTVYQSERYGDSTYEIPVTDATYSIKLHFTELYETSADRRLFSLSVEGEPVIENLDIFEEASGNFTAYDVVANDIMVADGHLTIKLTSHMANASIVGFAIYSNDGGQFVAPPEPETCDLPNRLNWTSTGPIIAPPSGAAAIKDPTIVKYNGRYHVFATIWNGNWNSVYLNFTDWSNARNAQISNFRPGNSSTIAPQVFFFEPENRWYLFTQWPARYTSTTDISNPNSWSTLRRVFPNYDPPGNDLDYWVICNDTTCYLYWFNDEGPMFYVKTPIGNFPNFPSSPVMQANIEGGGRQNIVFEAGNIYKIQGSDQYLLQVEGWGSSEGRRLYRSWTSNSLDGPWRAHLTSEDAPFAGLNNVTFEGGNNWSQQISHGEMIRAGYDQKMELSACDMEFLYQGGDFRNFGGKYEERPYSLGLLRQRD